MTSGSYFRWRGQLPVWAVVIAAPLAGVFLLSLAAAGAVLLTGAAVAALVVPRLRDRHEHRDPRTIELDSSEFRRLPRTDGER